MNPIFQWAVIHSTLKKRARRCSRCGALILVPGKRIMETVACDRCGSPLPPSARVES